MQNAEVTAIHCGRIQGLKKSSQRAYARRSRRLGEARYNAIHLTSVAANELSAKPRMHNVDYSICQNGQGGQGGQGRAGLGIHARCD